MNYRHFGFISISLLCLSKLPAQDSLYARKTIETLCSPGLQGRGYYKNGAIKASDMIAAEMKNAGLEPIGSSYFQTYGFPVNVFEKDPLLMINGKKLKPGFDYVVNADAPASEIAATAANWVWVNMENIKKFEFRNKCRTAAPRKFNEKKQTGLAFYIIDTLPESIKKEFGDFLRELQSQSNCIVIEKNKLTWSAATGQSEQSIIYLLNSSDNRNLLNQLTSVKWKITSKMKKTTQRNVVGYIRGAVVPDSFIMVTAHYDHLGRMGPSALFPGANDNAAGVAMILDLAKYYKKNKPAYSMIFIAFSGEEPGLIGSGVYAQNPAHPLKKTRFLLNLDLVGTGETGMTVVNGSVFKSEFHLLDSLNSQMHALSKITARGKAANSDHYHFTELGIPSFFWYQSGPRSSYHDVYDVPGTLTLYGYVNTIKLSIAFFRALGN